VEFSVSSRYLPSTGDFDILLTTFLLFIPLGYIKARSVPSLAAGLTFGVILAGGAYMNSQNPPKPLLQLSTALALGGMMGYK
jgi:Transmembrane proteins 14C